MVPRIRRDDDKTDETGPRGAGFKAKVRTSNGSWAEVVKGLEVRIVRSAEDLSALASEWNNLVLRCPDYYLSQSFQWAETAWEIIGQPRGYELNCLTLWSEERLVALWPLVIRRDHGLRIAHPLGFEGDEYCAPLVEPGDDFERRVAFLWQVAAGAADLAILPHVRAGSPLADILKATKHWRVTYPAPSPYVARADYSDWAAYHATISSQLRSQIRRRRRKLSEKGKVVVGRESPAGCAALIDWLLDHKKRWLVRTEHASKWLHRPDARDFLVALTERQDVAGDVALFALKVDGVPIAAYLVCIDRSRVECYVSAYNPEWSFYSPGAILIEYLLQWAFERNLNFDFRIGDQSYKYKWTKRSCNTIHWQIATGSRGIPIVMYLRAAVYVSQLRQKLAIGYFLPSKWRYKLRAILKRSAKLSTPT